MDDIELFNKLISESNNIVFFGGAGVSTESGIKDFRGKNGIYKTKSDYDFPPEYLLSCNCLYENPLLFFKYYKENMDFTDREPNITHQALKKLEDVGKLKAIVTQNIDGLHQKAGSKNVLEIHGTTYKNYCIKCYKDYAQDFIFKSSGIPTCECGGIVRPDVILYGESLPDDFNKAIDYISRCDMLIVAGTSLTVQPAASLVRYYSGDKLVIINEDETPYDYLARVVIHEPLGKVFSSIKLN